MTKRASYGIIETIGGFVMARSYRHIQQYEKEILELKEQGLTLRQIGERLYPPNNTPPISKISPSCGSGIANS